MTARTGNCNTCGCQVCVSVADCQDAVLRKLAATHAAVLSVQVDARLLAAAASVVLTHARRYEAGGEQALDAAVTRLATAMGMDER